MDARNDTDFRYASRAVAYDHFMKQKQILGLALTGLCLLGLASNLQAGLFTNSFAPANWEIRNDSSNPGIFEFTGLGDAEILTITGAASGSSETIVVIKPPCPSPALLSFTWTVVRNGNDGPPEAGYLVDDVLTPLVGNSGTNDLSLPAGTTSFGFVLGANPETGKNPPVFAITGWEAEMVPEAGTWLAAALALGVALVEWRRRQPSKTVVPRL